MISFSKFPLCPSAHVVGMPLIVRFLQVQLRDSLGQAANRLDVMYERFGRVLHDMLAATQSAL